MKREGPFWGRTVFRLTGLPQTVVTRDDAAGLLSQCFPDIQTDHVNVCSLATTLAYWISPPSKVATVMFSSLPNTLRADSHLQEWVLHYSSNKDPLLLDRHFHGMTPLSDASNASDSIECISVSGLASHAFGSWQPKGDDKTFMWIRDELPQALPNTRAIIFGYNSQIDRSLSFQRIPDIARLLIDQLRTYWRSFPSKGSFLFLGHSLGGLIVEEIMVQLAKNSDDCDIMLLKKIKGGVLFGVPNTGMDQSGLQTLVEGQPNEQLIEDLASNSNYIRQLKKSFSGLSSTRNFRFFWAYETEMTQIATRDADGQLRRGGDFTILVTHNSATQHCSSNNLQYAFPIAMNHSEMVKFGRGSPYIHSVTSKLASLIQPYYGVSNTLDLGPDMIKHDVRYKKTPLEEVMDSLKAPDLDARRKQIELRFENTFEWIFHDHKFVSWLHEGQGIFWIRGKPGSGKSTLMRLIFEDQRTKQLLHKFMSGAKEVFAAFFFHFRGSALQKTFEGLLRSLLAQILHQQPKLLGLLNVKDLEVQPDIPGLGKSRFWNIPRLEEALQLILSQRKHKLHMTLLFDAVDEFEGHPEAISRFLQSMVQKAPDSSTLVKILFSSRPEEILIKNFDSCPGLSIHDRSTGDIRQYCNMKLPLVYDGGKRFDIASDVVRRSQGVFLWVKLVTQELTDFINISSTSSHSSMKDLLQEKLRSIPVELDEYFKHIVERIPPHHRWETFVILETLVRSQQTLNAEDLVSILRCSNQQTLQGCQNEISSKDLDLQSEARVLCRRFTGGLAEFVGKQTVQLMHQTVHEFVTREKFKTIYFGANSFAYGENGFSFLAKYKLATSRVLVENDAFIMAHEAEKTNLHSLKTFLDSFPNSQRPRKQTALEIAVKASLFIYLEESHSQLATTHEPLFSYLLQHHSSGTATPALQNLGLQTAKALLQGGYKVERELTIFKKINHELRALDGNDFATHLFILLLSSTLESNGTLSDAEPKIQGIASEALRVATPKIATWLLDRGMDPNTQDPSGNTPLDWFLSSECSTVMSPRTRLKNCRVLIERGGRARLTTAWQWRTALAEFHGLGGDLNFLRSHMLTYTSFLGLVLNQVAWVAGTFFRDSPNT